MKLSIIIPCYNEEKTILAILDRVLAVKMQHNLEKEVIVIDDGSVDKSRAKVMEYITTTKRFDVNLISKPNQGKGSAIRKGLEAATGDLVIVQDADLEYFPDDYNKLVSYILQNNAYVVYGNRWHSGNSAHSYYRFFWGGLFLTFLTNMLFGSRIHDEPTCYKLFKVDVLKKIKLTCNGFDFCPEITAKVLRAGYEIHEVPIKYEPRSLEEGKKITWRDGLIAIFTLIKLRFVPKKIFYLP